MPILFPLSQAKSVLRLKDTDTVRDQLLQDFIDGVTTVIEELVGPVSSKSVTIDVRDTGRAVVLPYMNVISLGTGTYIADDSVVDVTKMYVDASGVLRMIDGSLLPYSPWRLTAMVGMAIIPAAIQRAAGEILILAWATQRQIPGNDAPAFLIPYRAAAWLAGFERPPRVV